MSEWRRRYRRPQYSQSFTFHRRRHGHQRKEDDDDGEEEKEEDDLKTESADVAAPAGDDPRQRYRPRTSTYSADARSAPDSRLTVNNRNRYYDTRTRTDSRTGYQQPMSINPNTMHINYIYNVPGVPSTASSGTSNGEDDDRRREEHYRRHRHHQQQQEEQREKEQQQHQQTPTDQRQALTLGQTVSRNEDGSTLQLQNGRGASQADTNNNYRLQEYERRRQHQQEQERQRLQQQEQERQRWQQQEQERQRQQQEQERQRQQQEQQRQREQEPERQGQQQEQERQQQQEVEQQRQQQEQERQRQQQEQERQRQQQEQERQRQQEPERQGQQQEEQERQLKQQEQEQQRQQQQEQERQRQQEEYQRRQEDHRREILRRRTLAEEQRAAREAEYKRRLDEHNLRLQQRQKEIEERMRLSGHLENNHNASHPHQHNRHRHHHGQRHPHDQQQQQESQSNTSLSDPASAGNGQSSSVHTRISSSDTTDPRRSDPRYNSQVQPTDPRYNAPSQPTDPRYNSHSQSTDPRYNSHSQSTDPRYNSHNQPADPRYNSHSQPTDPRSQSALSDTLASSEANAGIRRTSSADFSDYQLRQREYFERLRQQQLEQQRQQQQQAESTFYARGTNRRNPYSSRTDSRGSNDDDRSGVPETPQPTATSTRNYITNPADRDPEVATTDAVPLPSADGVPNTRTSANNAASDPDDLYQDSRRSSLTAASSAVSDDDVLSNELPDASEDSLVIGSEKNLAPSVANKDKLSGTRQFPNSDENSQAIGSGGSIPPNVIESGTLIGEEDEGLIVVGGEAMPYEWRVSGLTDCTLSCGGGVQQTVVVCLDTRTQAVVTDNGCQLLTRPKSKAVTCNTRPCPAEWSVGEWSACSVTCGSGGLQTRTLNCQARISATLNMSMPEESCRTSVRPEDRRRCESQSCWQWRIGNWSQCSVPCGRGLRTRQIICVDSTGYDVMEDLCTESKPTSEETCDMGTCGKGWYFTDWPEHCPARCGGGTIFRHVTCLGDQGQRLPDVSCDRSSRPEQQKGCRADGPCGGEWFTGDWEKCNVTCGEGFRERDVVCMKTLPGGLLTVVGEENCAAALKPEIMEPCQREACQSEWYMTPWSECSQSCGTGQRTREVKCLDPHQRPSSDCPVDRKPRTRDPCNTDSCQTRTLPGTVPSDCTDSFSRCEIVKHARMCRYPYYRKKCCITCAAEDT